jgi:prepilin-type N-terminal cleavage/methylation domain-containing protein
MVDRGAFAVGAGAQVTGSEPNDDGFTLTEVLVGMVVMGLLMAVLSAAIIVVSKQSVVSSAALDAARTEQLIGMWLPTDLASNDDVFLTLPTASPCDGSCPTGTELAGSSNALLLSWTKNDYVGGEAVVVRTRVSYRYRPVNGSYELHRVECTIVGAASQTCRTSVAARGMQPPPSGVFDAGIGPDWALRATKVTIAAGQDQYTEKQAIQVILRILESIPGRQATGEAKSVMFTVG